MMLSVAAEYLRHVSVAATVSAAFEPVFAVSGVGVFAVVVGFAASGGAAGG